MSPNPHKIHPIGRPEGQGTDGFCEFNLWLSSGPVAAVLNTIYCFIRPRYNGTRHADSQVRCDISKIINDFGHVSLAYVTFS